MTVHQKSKVKQAGLAPGALVYTGARQTEKVSITVIDYDKSNYQKKQPASISACAPYKDSETVSWIQINGLHDVEMIKKVGEHFGLHNMVLEDILHTTQRPKLEDYDDYLFVVMKMLTFNESRQAIETEQFSLLLGKQYVITFQESDNDVFAPIRERIKKTNARHRRLGADYLLFTVIDCIIDHYFIVLEKLDEKIEKLQEQIDNNPTEETLHKIHAVKKELVMLRKAFWPTRELAGALLKNESDLIHENTHIYFKDIQDHILRVFETAESFRDMTKGMLDVYLTITSNKMNSVMKVLTIIATIFIPLSFLVGVYGMNFRNMPEYTWSWAYPVFWILVLSIVTGMLLVFRKIKWL
ncbi:MAG: magnesium/cobalt transporter CorA [Planctomycetes bacterium]|nr:magnesium/cobalt transporter CorA [Planctomycetota bacterium]